MSSRACAAVVGIDLAQAVTAPLSHRPTKWPRFRSTDRGVCVFWGMRGLILLLFSEESVSAVAA